MPTTSDRSFVYGTDLRSDRSFPDVAKHFENIMQLQKQRLQS